MQDNQNSNRKIVEEKFAIIYSNIIEITTCLQMRALTQQLLFNFDKVASLLLTFYADNKSCPAAL